MAVPFSRPLALTQGDPAGVGPDITLAAWLRRRELGLAPFFFIGDPDVLAVRARQLGVTVPIRHADASTAGVIFAEALPVLPIAAGVEVAAGEPHVATAAGTIAAIETAVALTHKGEALAVVTNPIAKSVLYEAGFKFPGHTEFLADLAARATGKAMTPVMMLAGPKLRAIPVTIHIPIRDVPQALTGALIVETCRIANADLIERFGIAQPRLAVAGLNPHAGESELLGDEERRAIVPGIAQARRRLRTKAELSGPVGAESAYRLAYAGAYDGVVAMYHDQATIPTKLVAFGDAVNVTLGLSRVRTSVDHGTAYDIAWQGKADANGMRAALRLAQRLVQ